MLQRSSKAKAGRILVLADTHDRLPPRVIDLARTADEIWHLGDVCAENLLDELRAAGPKVLLVRGNCDYESSWPLVLDIKRARLRIRLQHIPPSQPPADVDVLLHGHTHVPRHERVGGVLFLNPGCVTRPNQGAAASVAWLTLGSDGDIGWELVAIRKD